jgi:hypothetical protein
LSVFFVLAAAQRDCDPHNGDQIQTIWISVCRSIPGCNEANGTCGAFFLWLNQIPAPGIQQRSPRETAMILAGQLLSRKTWPVPM